MKKNLMKAILSILIVILLLASLSSREVMADSGSNYKTYTTDSSGNLIGTQDAYLYAKKVTEFTIDGVVDYLSNPDDIYYQEDLKKFYIADTGNHRILVTDKNFKNAVVVGENILKNPRGVYANKDGVIYVADYTKKAVYIFTPNGEDYLVDELLKPNHPLYAEAEFKPSKICADAVGTMYIIDSGNENGLVQITSAKEFSGYFGANYVKPDFEYIVKFIFSTKEQKKKLYRSPISPTNLTIDEDGLVNTVTAGLTEGSLKKLNISGSNIIKEDIYSSSEFTDIAMGPTKTIYAVDKSGYIYEYSSEGELLFVFGGYGEKERYSGLFVTPKSVEVDEDYKLYVLDQNSISIFVETEFASYVHEALVLYNNGLYKESRVPWTRVLEKNSMFDLAHKGLGNAYLRETSYNEALKEFKVAKDANGYSNAFWEVRNVWIMNYGSIIILGIVILIVGLLVVDKFNLLNGLKRGINKLKTKVNDNKFFSQFFYIFTFIKHPLNGFYGIKKEKKMGMGVATIWYVILFVIFAIGEYQVGFVFNTQDAESISITRIFTTFMLPIILFIISNYLISSITDGEGKFSDVYVATVCSFIPMIAFYPILILLSKALTLNEAFVYNIFLIVIWVWSGILLFFMIKDIENLQVGENIKNILLTIVTMILFVALAFLLYALSAQLFNFIKDFILEVISNG